MKITKRKLKRIIREEKNKLIAETRIRRTVRLALKEGAWRDAKRMKKSELVDLSNRLGLGGGGTKAAILSQVKEIYLEAALVLRYVGMYWFYMNTVLIRADSAKYRGGKSFLSADTSKPEWKGKFPELTDFNDGGLGYGAYSPYDAIRYLAQDLTLDVRGDNMQPKLINPADVRAIDDEAADVKNDPRTVREKVDDGITYLYKRTPMGMSAIEAADVYGEDIRPHADEIKKFFNVTLKDYIDDLEKPL